MSNGELKRRLVAPPVNGYRALFWAALAVVVPTLIRAALEGIVTGVAITPFIPFVVLAAVFLSWKYAAGVAIAAAIVADAIFIGPPRQLLEGPSDIFAVFFFLSASAMIIAFVQVVRNLFMERQTKRLVEARTSGIVFSSERGEAWAGWYGQSSRVRLGPEDEVADMMEDFLAQVELGKRFAEFARTR